MTQSWILGIYHSRLLKQMSTQNLVWMYIAALLISVKRQKQPNVQQQMGRQKWSTRTMEYWFGHDKEWSTDTWCYVQTLKTLC